MNTFPKRFPILAASLSLILVLSGCENESTPKDKRIRAYSPERVSSMAKAIESQVTPEIGDGLTLKLWGVDSLVADPVSIDIDDYGNLFYTRTNRQKNSEFDIRGHQDWEIESISLQTIEDKRAFLRKTLSPENSDKNKWLGDVNGDGSHDWRDMTIEKEHVYRISDTDGDGLADESQLVIEDFHEEVTDAAGGVLKHEEDLFIGIGPDLWRVLDKDNDGLADSKESLSHGYGVHIGFGGHGMSGIEVGPEGKIYWQIGDIGFNGKGKNGEKYEHPNSGVIVRANPDGSDFEVFSYGNRNTHEFVFDEYGNLISEDNDGDHPGESERIVYVVNGADIGWRINWQFGKYRDPDNNTYKVWMDEKLYVPRFEGQAAYILPPIINYVNGPTGMLYNPGTALGPEWTKTFFIAEFLGNPAQSGIHAFKLKPKGASFELAETKKILGGVLATGIDFGPDGAMYVADWIDGWETKDHGRIWKLDANGFEAERREVKQLLGDDFKKYDLDKLGKLLTHADMRIRQKSQFELARRDDKGMEVFKKYIAQKDHQLARVNSIWGVSQLARKDMKNAGVLVPLLQDSDPEIRAQAAKWIGDVRYKDAGEFLLPLLKDEYPRARFFAAEALGRIAYAGAVDQLIQLLAENDDQDVYIRHGASLALARIGNEDALKALNSHPSRAVRLGAVIALRRMGSPAVAGFLNDKEEFVVTEAARAINDDLSIEKAIPSLGAILNTTPFKNEPLIRRSINANLRSGSDDGIKALLTYAAGASNPQLMRAEALAALSTWAKPSVLDRVDGRYRGVVERNPENLIKISTGPLTSLANDKSALVRVESIKAIGKLKVEDASSVLLARLKTDNDAIVREEAVKALVSIGGKNTSEGIQVALRDRSKNVRVTALDLLPKLGLESDLMVSLLSEVINTNTVEERQAALITLGTVPVAKSRPVFEQLLQRHANNKFPVEATLELAEAIDNTKSKELKDRYKEISAKTAGDTVKAAFAGALFGGNPDRGSRVFYSNQSAQCIRCHSYGDYGGNAGPRLNGVANKLSREQLLEALIDPSARLAPGYGMITLELKDGNKISGILQEETSQGLKLKIGSKPDTLISATQIAKKTYAVSSMPPMRTLLTKREIRDVVSFLATMKE